MKITVVGEDCIVVQKEKCSDLSTKRGRQSTKGYAQGSDLSVDRCMRHEPDGNRTQDTRFIQVQAVSMT
jgi:hypothetical protein